MTGPKEVSNILYRCGHGISYTDIRLVNNAWAHLVTRSSKHKLRKGFQRVIPLHISIDNSDGKQQTPTGAHTTHHTNAAVFQIQVDNAIEGVNEERNDNNETFYYTSKMTIMVPIRLGSTHKVQVNPGRRLSSKIPVFSRDPLYCLQKISWPHQMCQK